MYHDDDIALSARETDQNDIPSDENIASGRRVMTIEHLLLVCSMI